MNEKNKTEAEITPTDVKAQLSKHDDRSEREKEEYLISSETIGSLAIQPADVDDEDKSELYGSVKPRRVIIRGKIIRDES